MHINITPRSIAKFAAHCAVYQASASTYNSVVTSIDSDPDPHVRSESTMIGAAAMMVTWNRVDNAVDRVANWRMIRKMKKAAKKSK